MYRIDSIIVSNSAFTSDVTASVIGASLSMSTNAVAQLTISFAEFEDFRITRTGIFSPGASMFINDSLGRAHRYEIAVLQIDERQAPIQLTVAARSYAAQSFKRNKEALVKRNLSPTEFLRIEALAVGGIINAEGSQNRGSISRVNNENQQESTWDVMNKMAGELGYLFFEYEGVFNFGRPTWFAGRPTTWWFEYDGGLPPSSFTDIIGSTQIITYGLPSCRRSEDDKNNYATVDLSVGRTLGALVRPGNAVYFSGVPFWEGKYIVQSVQMDMMNEAMPVSVSLVTPVDPKKPSTSGGGGDNDDLSDLDVGGSGQLLLRDFLTQDGQG